MSTETKNKMILTKQVWETPDKKYRRILTVDKGVQKDVWYEHMNKDSWYYSYRSGGYPGYQRKKRANAYQEWCKHRKDGPAVTVTYPDGTVIEKYYQNDRLHREDGPASYHEKGKLKGVPMYRLKGKPVSAYKVLGEDSKEAFAHALKYEDGKNFT